MCQRFHGWLPGLSPRVSASRGSGGTEVKVVLCTTGGQTTGSRALLGTCSFMFHVDWNLWILDWKARDVPYPLLPRRALAGKLNGVLRRPRWWADLSGSHWANWPNPPRHETRHQPRGPQRTQPNEQRDVKDMWCMVYRYNNFVAACTLKRTRCLSH